MLDIRNVRKAYHSKVAVDGISLSIGSGQVFGLLGPNGAGKTSLIRMITHITQPDSGEILLNNEPLRPHHQRQIGYMPEERGLYRKMKVGEQLLYLLRLKGMTRTDAQAATDKWLARMDLAEWGKAKVSELSKGMQQKVQFIATVAHTPPLVILDEPFSGLDPLNAQLMEDVIGELAAAGTTVIFSTHRMEQVERFCPRIALINNGQIVLEGEVHALRRQFRKPVFAFEADTAIDPARLPSGFHCSLTSPYAATLTLAEPLPLAEVARQLADVYPLTRVEHVLPGLRDIFIEAVTAPAAPVTA